MADHPVRGNWLVVIEMWSLAKAGSGTAGGFPPVAYNEGEHGL